MGQEVHVAASGPLFRRLLIMGDLWSPIGLPIGAEVYQVILLSVVTASISFTVTETKMFKPLREWAKMRSSFLGGLLSCGYCTGHWVAFALVAYYQPRVFSGIWPLAYFLTALVITWLAAFQWILLCRLMKAAGK